MLWRGDANNTSSTCCGAPRSARPRKTSRDSRRCRSCPPSNGLLSFERVPDDVDDRNRTPGYVGVTARAAGGFQPLTNIDDARQRWLFRMVHSERPLQEKMALFWHNHFATAYSKIAGHRSAPPTRPALLAAKTGEDRRGRRRADRAVPASSRVGNFRDLLVAVAKDPAMLVWLDGRLNVRGRPQENFARELMELFTMGVGTFQETDVYAGARVFTGWNLARAGATGTTRSATCRAARHRRQGVLVPDLSRTAAA